MAVKLAFAFFLLPFLGAPVYAQSLRVECFKAAQDQLKQCLDSAISEGGKNSCAQRQQGRAKVCENGECEVESDMSKNGIEDLTQKK